MSAGPGSPGRASPERGNVRVVCRVRPQNQIEVDRGGTPCVSLSDTSIQIVTEDGDTSFTFDHVFGQDSKQREVFDYVAAPTVADVMSGYNATIFAYGQTGSGKTFTMEGADIDDGELRGVIPRTADALFQAIADADASIEFVVKVSYVEIYCEKIRDLLDEYRTKVNLPIREDRQKGVYISGVTEEYITGPEELLAVMARGATNRAVAATGMNSGSSRSHSVFTVEIASTETTTGATRTGKMVLVDLAGSEMVRKTGASGTQLKEAQNINKSLSALGQVINALTDGRSTHVPFRDSKLTRLLQNSLGGNSKTNLIINVSPSTYNAPETISTCRFGSRAKRIKNAAVVNEVRSAAELENLLKHLEGELAAKNAYIATLESEGGGGGDGEKGRGIDVAAVGLTQLQEELEEERAEAGRFREENEKLREALAEKETMLAEASELIKEAERQVTEQKGRADAAQLQLDSQIAEVDEAQAELQGKLEKAVFDLNEARLEKGRLRKDVQRLNEELDGLAPGARDTPPPAAKGGPVAFPPTPEAAAEEPATVVGVLEGEDVPPLDDVLDAMQAPSEEGLALDILNVIKDRESHFQARIASFEKLEQAFVREKQKLLHRVAEAESQKDKLAADLTSRCERIMALEQVLGATAQSGEATSEGGLASAPGTLDQVRLLQQRLEQLVAVHRKLLRKYARLELECAETRGKVTLRDERIAQLEFHARQMGAGMRRQAQRHVEEIQKLRAQVAVLREEQREQAAQARFLATGSSRFRSQVRALRGGYHAGDEDGAHVKRSVRGGGGGAAKADGGAAVDKRTDRRRSFLGGLFSR